MDIKLKERFKNKAFALKTGVTTLALSTACVVPAFAAEGDSSGISINFDVTQMFKFANIIIDSLMPVVHITAGLGIGFLIINSLKNAFRS